MPHRRFKTSQVELSRLIQNGIAFALSVAIATWIGLTLERSTGIALIWPPTGIILAMLLAARAPRHGWKRAGILALGLSTNFAVLVALGRSEITVARDLTACFIEAMVAFALLRGDLDGRSNLARPKRFLLFAALDVATACLASALCIAVLFGFSRLELLPVWWASHVLGLIVTTPLVLALAGRQGAFRAFEDRRAGAVLLLGLTAVAVGAMVAATFTQNDLPLLFLPFVPLVVALWFGPSTVAWALPLSILMAVLCGAASNGPLKLAAIENSTFRLVGMQIYLATLITTLLPLSSAIARLHRSKQVFGRRTSAVREVAASIRESEQLYRVLADNSSDIISRFSLDGNRLYVSPSVVDILGWPAEEMLGADYRRYIHPDDAEALRAMGARLGAGATERATQIYRNLRRDGTWAWLEARVILVRNADGSPRELIGNTRDVSHQKETELALAAAAADLTELAATDALTGVANRRRFDEMLDREWRRAMRSHAQLSMLLIDVDHFKLFNDQYGHLMGDTCLHAIATAIASSVRRPGDLVARYGGEEFAVILPDTDGSGAMEIAARVREGIAALAMPHIGNRSGHVTVSIGSAEAVPNRSTASSVLVEAADAALYEAKRLGRDRTERAPMIDMAENIMVLPWAIRREG